MGIVEEESSLGCGFLFEGNGRVLGLAGLLDVDAGDLTAVAELAPIVQQV